MNWLRTLLTASLAVAALVTPAAAQTDMPRLALVIGQSDYNGDGRPDTPTEISDRDGFARDLAKPSNDADDVTGALTRLKFDVTTIKDASRTEMMASIAAFGQKVSEAGRRAIVVIYYSGHAMQVDGVNFLIPARARLPSGFDFRRFNAATTQEIIGGETVSLAFIMSQLDDPEDGLNVVVLDSCRNNWWDSQVNGVSRGGRGGGLSSQMRVTRGGAERTVDLGSTLIAYSTQPGNVADDGGPGERNSPYTAALKTHLEQPGLTVQQLFNRTARAVETTTATWTVPQRPWNNYAGSLPEICLAGCANEAELQMKRELEAALQRVKQLELASRSGEAPRAQPATIPAAEQKPLSRPITVEDLRQIVGRTTSSLPSRGLGSTRPDFTAALVVPFNELLPQYGISTPQRMAHFLAQMAHETDGFRALEEYASGEAYEGRKSLGNTEPGDGVRYKGRGIMQITGRRYYREYGEFIGVDLEAFPELASSPRVAVRIALEYWARNTRNGSSMNALADADDIESITRRLNGGLNGIEDRRRKVELAKRQFGIGPAA